MTVQHGPIECVTGYTMKKQVVMTFAYGTTFLAIVRPVLIAETRHAKSVFRCYRISVIYRQPLETRTIA